MKRSTVAPELLLHSAESTRRVGRRLGEVMVEGEVVGLRGELGSGKTTLAGGLAAGLGVDEMVVSPSFTIIREYRGRIPFYHLDLYRLREEREMIDIGVPAYLCSDGAAVVEWCERLGSLAPAEWLELELRQGRERDERRIFFRAHGEDWERKLEEMWPSLAGAAAEGHDSTGSLA